MLQKKSIRHQATRANKLCHASLAGVTCIATHASWAHGWSDADFGAIAMNRNLQLVTRLPGALPTFEQRRVYPESRYKLSPIRRRNTLLHGLPISHKCLAEVGFSATEAHL